MSDENEFLHACLINDAKQVTKILDFQDRIYYTGRPKYFQIGFFTACFNGCLDVVSSIISRPVNLLNLTIITSGILYSRIGEQYNIERCLKIMDLLLEMYEEYNNLTTIVRCKEFSLTEALISHDSFDVNIGLQIACVSDHLLFAQEIVKYGATCFTVGLRKAFEFGSVELVRYMLQRGARINCFYECIGNCNTYNNSKNIQSTIEIAELLLNLSSNNKIYCALNDDVVPYLLERGFRLERFEPASNVNNVKHNIETFRHTIQQQKTVLIPEFLNMISQYSLY